MTILILVTARGGSKGFPGKNTALLAGRPLVAWSHKILSDLRVSHSDVLMHLSTDSAAIAECWPEEDRPERLRPSYLAADDTTSLAVVEYEVNQFEAEGHVIDAVLLLQPTSPLLATADLAAALELWRNGAESIAGIARCRHPPQWAYGLDQGRLKALSSLGSDRRRQDVEPAYAPVGFWLIDLALLRRQRVFIIPGITCGVVVPESRAVDIDHRADLDLAVVHMRRERGERPFRLGDRLVGVGEPCFIIAEVGVNHNGDPDLALKLIQEAAASGADAVKFQSFRARDLVTASAVKAAYQEVNTGISGTQLEMLEKLEFPVDVFRRLKAESERQGLVFLSSPFEAGSSDMLANLGISAFKLGSGELTNLPFLAKIASYGRPILLSTGMADLSEVEAAISVIRAHGDPPTAVLHCVSTYPAPIDQSNLRAMETLRIAIGGPVGMSDHSLGDEVSLAAVAMGATVLERHLTLDRGMPGPDHAASMEPGELRTLIQKVRRLESALGDGVKRAMPCELDTRAAARKSLVLTGNLPAGHRLGLEDLALKRPGNGIPARCLGRIVGRRLKVSMPADALLAWEDLDEAGP